MERLTSRNCQKFTEHAGFKQVAPAAEFYGAGNTVFAVHRSSGRKLRLRCHWQNGQSTKKKRRSRVESDLHVLNAGLQSGSLCIMHCRTLDSPDKRGTTVVTFCRI